MNTLRTIIFLWLLCVNDTAVLLAQKDTDTKRISIKTENTLHESLSRSITDMPKANHALSIDSSVIRGKADIPAIQMLNTNENNELHGNYDIYGYMPLWAWKNINIDVSGEQQHYIGLANISSGTMAVDLSLPNLYIRLYGKANKFSYYHGLQTVWGMGGIINYQISRRLSLCAFGEFYTRNPYIGHAAMPYLPYNCYGGYLRVETSGPVNMDLGVQSRYNAYDRSWETLPIVRPYLNTKSKVKLGIDFGSPIKNILMSIFGK